MPRRRKQSCPMASAGQEAGGRWDALAHAHDEEGRTDWQLWVARARRAVDAKAKPPGSLGLLEEWAVKLAALQQTLSPSLSCGGKLLVFAADHGITSAVPGVSAFPRAVTQPIFKAISNGVAASAVLCRASGCTIEVVDVGVDAPDDALRSNAGWSAGSTLQRTASFHGVTTTLAKVRRGSHDMTEGPALRGRGTDMQAACAVGRAAVDRYIEEAERQHPGTPPSAFPLCIGELGIGNTTAAAAIVAAISGEDPASVCGKGTGLDDKGVATKAAVIRKALEVNADRIRSKRCEGILEAVGGLEIAAMVGAFLHAGERGMPLLVDGFVSGAAALLALLASPEIQSSLFWAHRSDEKGTHILLREAARLSDPAVNIRPPLDMSLRLGEGTGAVLALPLLRSACAIMGMATLDEAVNGT